MASQGATASSYTPSRTVLAVATAVAAAAATAAVLAYRRSYASQTSLKPSSVARTRSGAAASPSSSRVSAFAAPAAQAQPLSAAETTPSQLSPSQRRGSGRSRGHSVSFADDADGAEVKGSAGLTSATSGSSGQPRSSLASSTSAVDSSNTASSGVLVSVPSEEARVPGAAAGSASEATVVQSADQAVQRAKQAIASPFAAASSSAFPHSAAVSGFGAPSAAQGEEKEEALATGVHSEEVSTDPLALGVAASASAPASGLAGSSRYSRSYGNLLSGSLEGMSIAEEQKALRRASDELDRWRGRGGAQRTKHGTKRPVLSGIPDANQVGDWEQLLPKGVALVRTESGEPEMIGTGGYGKVYKALQHGATPLTVKVFSADAGPSVDARRTVAVLKGYRHSNLVRLVDVVHEDCGPALVVQEQVPGGDLWQRLHGRGPSSSERDELLWHKRRTRGSNPGSITPGCGAKLAADIANALAWLHGRKIVHMHLKSTNVLIGADGTAKVGDLIQVPTKAIDVNGPGVRRAVDPLGWAAPEVVLGQQRVSDKVDIYSLGVILRELATGLLPRRGACIKVRVPEDCSHEIARLIERCLAERPEDRPGANEVAALLGANLAGAPQRRGLSEGFDRSQFLAQETLHHPAELLDAMVEYTHAVEGKGCDFSYEEASRTDPCQLVGGRLPTYEVFVNRLRTCLAQTDVEDPKSQAHKYVVKLVMAWRKLVAAIAVINPQHVPRMQDINWEMLGKPAAGYSAFAAVSKGDQRAVLAALRLSARQKQQLNAAHSELVDKRLRELGEERKRLMRRLETFTMGGSDEAGGDYAGIAGFAGAVETSEAIKANLQEESTALALFYNRTFYGLKPEQGIVTPLQSARARVAAWPFSPDPVIITGYIAEELEAAGATARTNSLLAISKSFSMELPPDAAPPPAASQHHTAAAPVVRSSSASLDGEDAMVTRWHRMTEGDRPQRVGMSIDLPRSAPLFGVAGSAPGSSHPTSASAQKASGKARDMRSARRSGSARPSASMQLPDSVGKGPSPPRPPAALLEARAVSSTGSETLGLQTLGPPGSGLKLPGGARVGDSAIPEETRSASSGSASSASAASDRGPKASPSASASLDRRGTQSMALPDDMVFTL